MLFHGGNRVEDHLVPLSHMGRRERERLYLVYNRAALWGLP